MADIPEGFDPNVAHIIDADGNVFQELAPPEYIEVPAGVDEDGKAITREVELPREWDEAATVAAMNDG